MRAARIAEELFVDGKVPEGVRDRRVLPDPLQNLVREFVATQESIDDVLIRRVAELHDDVAHGRWEPRIPNQAEQEGVKPFVAVALADCDHRMRAKGFDDGGNGVHACDGRGDRSLSTAAARRNQAWKEDDQDVRHNGVHGENAGRPIPGGLHGGGGGGGGGGAGTSARRQLKSGTAGSLGGSTGPTAIPIHRHASTAAEATVHTTGRRP
jgi:hypothetical protein